MVRIVPKQIFGTGYGVCFLSINLISPTFIFTGPTLESRLFTVCRSKSDRHLLNSQLKTFYKHFFLKYLVSWEQTRHGKKNLFSPKGSSKTV